MRDRLLGLSAQGLLDWAPDFCSIVHHPNAGHLKGFHLFGRSALATGDDRTGVAHAAARRCGDPSDKADDRFFHILSNVFSLLFFRIPAVLLDHDGGPVLGIQRNGSNHPPLSLLLVLPA